MPADRFYVKENQKWHADELNDDLALIINTQTGVDSGARLQSPRHDQHALSRAEINRQKRNQNGDRRCHMIIPRWKGFTKQLTL